MANIGNCPKCKQPNPYKNVVCDFCGARLPWADAIQDSRRAPAPAPLVAPPAVPPPVPQLPAAPSQGFPAPPPMPPGYAPQQPGVPAPMPPGYGPQQPGYGPPAPPPNGQICERCGFVGSPVSHTPGSFLVELGLWLLFCAPGIIYSLWRVSSRRSVCPRCQGAMLPLRSPGGAALYGRFYGGR